MCVVRREAAVSVKVTALLSQAWYASDNTSSNPVAYKFTTPRSCMGRSVMTKVTLSDPNGYDDIGPQATPQRASTTNRRGRQLNKRPTQRCCDSTTAGHRKITTAFDLECATQVSV